MNGMYDILKELPLFRGIDEKQLGELISKTKFHFLKYLTGETVLNAGEPCTHIKFIISGAARFTISNYNERVKVSQTLEAPNVIAPEFLFGKDPFYPSSGFALETTGILQIAKQDYVRILNSGAVFLYNYLNTISTEAQKGVDGILAVTSGSLDQRIAFWIIALTQSGATDITLTCKQRDLYSLFGVQRSSFIATLDSMKEKGLIDYNSTEINVTSRAGLTEMLNL